MFYDKFAERNVLQYCKLTKSDIPPQHVMDKLCIAPKLLTILLRRSVTNVRVTANI